MLKFLPRCFSLTARKGTIVQFIFGALYNPSIRSNSHG
jgi:hypothetical protein